MNTVKTNRSAFKLVHLAAAVVLAVSFFLPWVNWDGSNVSGADMAMGRFFKISDQRFGVSNPFPQMSFAFYAFWLIPGLAAASAILTLMGKKTVPLSFIAGTMSLGLVTIYILFSRTLLDVGVDSSIMSMLKPSAFIHVLAAIIFIISAYGVKTHSWKLGWLILGPVIAFSAFKFGERSVMAETHIKTENVKVDYKLTADSLLQEFILNDTAANRKYNEKMLEINGNVSVIEVGADSSSTMKFSDSTGSYAIFSFEKKQVSEIQSIKEGDPVSIKAVCSGSIFSEILGTTSISFKRATLIKNK